jgi:hypothetical protein
MSNQVRRPPLRGIILQGDRIVGGLDLPVPAEPFITQFNREYAAIRLRVEIHQLTSTRADGEPVVPVAC